MRIDQLTGLNQMENLRPVLETLSDEIFFEIFDRLSPWDLFQTFDGLNQRLNTILNDSRLRFRDDISSLKLEQFHFYIQHILPQILNRLTSFTFGSYDTDEYQQVHLFFQTYSIDLGRFEHLRSLVIIKLSISDIPQIESAMSQLTHLVNLRLSVDSNDVDRSSVINIGNNFFKNSRLKNVKMNMCARTNFLQINQISSIERFSIAWCSLQDLIHFLHYTPNLYTLKATICGLDSFEDHFAHLRLHSLKLVIESIDFDHLLLFLRQFSQLRSLWLILNHHEYLHVEKWQELFQNSLVNLDQLDLTIALTKPLRFGQINPISACEKFNSKFWFDHGWAGKLYDYPHCVRLIISNNLIPIIKKLKKE